MFFPIELWREICGFLIHNIKKHGKHLQINNKNIVNFNQVVQEIETIDFNVDISEYTVHPFLRFFPNV